MPRRPRRARRSRRRPIGARQLLTGASQALVGVVRSDAQIQSLLLRLVRDQIPRSSLSTGGPPSAMVVTLPYQELTTTSSVAQNDKIYSLNSVYDPNESGGGHQPRWFDQLLNGAIYNNYRVLWVDAEVRIVSNNVSMPASCYLVPNMSTTGLTYAGFPAELPGAVGGLFEEDNRLTIRKRFFPHEVAGLSPVEYVGSDDTQSYYGDSPSLQPLLHVWYGSNDGSTNMAVALTVILKYCVVVSQRVVPSYS